MSLYKDASLVMLPSAYKDGKLYSIRPTDGSGDFTFTRGSNLSATRVDASQLIEKGRENRLLQSNQFDTTWISPDATITSGQADKDGSNNAWLLTATSAFNRVAQSVSQSGVKRFSVYAKANVNDYLLLGCFEGAHYYATFNLATGAVDSNNINAILPSIENVGNGWYRCSATWVGTTTDVRIASQTTSGQGGWASTTSGSIYIQDAQLEQGLVATPYIETGASTAQAGILENTPRLDYSGGATCPSLLLEPSRTNQVQNSEYYESYDLNSVSISSNETTSPEGLSNAAELIEDSSNDNHFFRIPNLSWTSGTDVVFSIYFKENTRRYARLRFDNTGGNTRVWVDLRTGETTFIDATDSGVCTSVDVGNGWFRYEFKVTPSNTGTGSVQVFLQSEESVLGNLQTTYQGDGTSGIYVWGAQMEQGSYPTSYIPTYGVSQTRAVDDCKVEDLQSNGIVDTNWTYFFEWGKYVADRNFEIKNSLNTTFLFMVARMFRYNTNSGGVSTLTSLPSGVNEAIKVAVRYDGSSLKVFRSDGITNEVTDMDTSLFGDFDFLRLDRAFDDSEEFKQLLIFPTALTDSECIALTS